MTTTRFLIGLAVALALVGLGWALLWWSGFGTPPAARPAEPINYFVEDKDLLPQAVPPYE